jgi:hypothetical protein
MNSLFFSNSSFLSGKVAFIQDTFGYRKLIKNGRPEVKHVLQKYGGDPIGCTPQQLTATI